MQVFEQSGDKAGVALLFPGQGTQHIGMGEAVAVVIVVPRAFGTRSLVVGMRAVAVLRLGRDRIRHRGGVPGAWG